jgi:hypothetical protein
MSISVHFADEAERSAVLAERTLNHQLVIDRERLTWKLEESQGFKRILNPLASSLPYQTLNPNIYHRVELIKDLSHFADLINAPSDWKEFYHKVFPGIARTFKRFQNLPNETSQVNVQVSFQQIVTNIALLLSIKLNRMGAVAPIPGRIFAVAGIFAYPEYKVLSKTDLSIVNDLTGKSVLACLAKAPKTFPRKENLYYRECGVELFSALYANSCPTLLFCQTHYKLFVENQTRDKIYTFPSEISGPKKISTYMHSTAVSDMDNDFIKIIVISLLAGHGGGGRDVIPTYLSGFDAQGRPVRSDVRTSGNYGY